ncbi:peptidase [Pedobacter sp. HMWF019]|uniref:serine hydrolase domain-containing protein n=1 Tax=Pedobacter sp. HMWF019 TaxID=2056856 RepID=UPI000D357C1D|nr:serine hydrolase domain-containing protein [Pedobacter sp. HMWF019]PTS91929.1 peptidase [Pedobacter sp. HMWF019]
MKKITASLFAVFLLFAGVQAQEINTAKLDSFFNALAANNRCMGSFAISQKGKIIYQRSMGYSSLEDNNKILATSNTLYRIGSMTKMFTATLIFQLIEEGKLSLDTKLYKYFPQMPNAAKITIGNLLNHTSGLMDYVNDTDNKAWITNPHTKTELLQTITGKKVHFEPGAKQLYCNSGYLLLSYILEDITGQPYSKLIKNRISNKIGLQHTFSSKANESEKAEARPYQRTISWNKIKDIYFPNIIGVGDMLSTPADMLTFINALVAGKLVKPESYNQMRLFKDQDEFGMGLTKVPFYGKIGIGHGGDTYGSHSVTFRFDDDVSFSSSINGANYPVNDISIAVLSIFYHRPFNIPDLKPIEIKSEDLDAHLGIYASKQMPLKITFTKQGTVLMAQATGQPEFPLETLTKDKFKFDADDILIEFNTEKKEMILKQSGKTTLFMRE